MTNLYRDEKLKHLINAKNHSDNLDINRGIYNPRRRYRINNMYNTINRDSAQLFTVSEVCEKLKLGRNTVYNLINANKIKSVKVGTRRLFRTSDLVEFIGSMEDEVLTQ